MVSSTSIRVRNTTNEETANNKSSFSKRRRPDSAYSSHQSIRDEEVSGEELGMTLQNCPAIARVTRYGLIAEYHSKLTPGNNSSGGVRRVNSGWRPLASRF